MSAITSWQFSVDGVGGVQVFPYSVGYAGGFVLVGLGADDGTSFAVWNLGGGEIALETTVRDDPENQDLVLYWNSHYPLRVQNELNGMMLWTGEGYVSSSIGPEQSYRITNLGQGTVSLQATAGAYVGQYLTGANGGPYVTDWGYGVGSLDAAAAPVPLRLHGDLLALVMITSSGYRTDLTNRDLHGLDLTGADLRQCVLNGASLVGVTSLKGADATGASLRGAHLAGLDLSTAKTWTQADFTGSDLTTIGASPRAHLEGAILDGVNLTGRDLTGAYLSGAKLRGAVLTNTDLTGADLDGADLTGAQLGGTILHGASLQGTHFDGVDLTTAEFDSSPKFARSSGPRTTFAQATVPFATVLAADWTYLDLTGAVITGLPTSIPKLVADHALLPNGLDLQGKNLSGASFVGTRMYEVQLSRADLQGATLRSALLRGAKLVGANLALANLDSAYLIAEQAAEGAGLDLDKVEAAVVTDAFLFNTVLDGAHCDGVDFSGSFFVTAPSLSASQRASAVGASMNFAKFEMPTRWGRSSTGRSCRQPRSPGPSWCRELSGQRDDRHAADPVQRRDAHAGQRLQGRSAGSELHRRQHGRARHAGSHVQHDVRALPAGLPGLLGQEHPGVVHLSGDSARGDDRRHHLPGRTRRAVRPARREVVRSRYLSILLLARTAAVAAFSLTRKSPP